MVGDVLEAQQRAGERDQQLKYAGGQADSFVPSGLCILGSFSLRNSPEGLGAHERRIDPQPADGRNQHQQSKHSHHNPSRRSKEIQLDMHLAQNICELTFGGPKPQIVTAVRVHPNLPFVVVLTRNHEIRTVRVLRQKNARHPLRSEFPLCDGNRFAGTNLRGVLAPRCIHHQYGAIHQFINFLFVHQNGPGHAEEQDNHATYQAGPAVDTEQPTGGHYVTGGGHRPLFSAILPSLWAGAAGSLPNSKGSPGSRYRFPQAED